MNNYKNIPLVFLAYANKAKTDDIRVLEAENNRIAQILHPLEDSLACQIIREDPETNVFFIDIATQPAYRDRIHVVHLAGGNYGRKYIRFDSASGEVAMDADDFAEFLSQLPNLQLIFITRSASPRLVRKVMTQTGAAVIRTEDSPENAKVPEVFYKQLAKGKVIKRAFGQTTISCGDHLMYEIFTMAELTAPPFQRRDIYEGLYVNAEARAVLDWRMSPSFFILGEGDRASEKPGNELERKGRWEPPPWVKPVMAGITSLVGVALLMFAIFSQVPDRLMGQITSSTVCPFPVESNTYHILILPFFEAPGCGSEDRKFKTAIREQLEAFRERTGLNINIQYHDAKCPTSELFAKGVGGSCNANLIIWGTYSPSERIGETLVDVRYSTTDQFSEYQLIANLEDNISVTTENFESSQQALARRVIDIVYWGLAVKYYRQNRFETTLELLTNIKDENEVSYSVVDRLAAACYFELGSYELAIERYDNAIELDRNSREAYIDRGNAYVKLKNYEAALSDFEKAYEISPRSTEVLLARGNLYKEMGQYKLALNDYNLAVITAPKSPETFLYRGQVHAAMRNDIAAISDFDQSIRLNPTFSAAYINKGKVFENRRNFDQAFVNYSLAILQNKTDPAAYYERGRLHNRYYRFEQGLLDLQEAISINPNKAEYYLERSMAYQGIGEYQGLSADTLAISDVNKALQLSPQSSKAFAYRGIIQTKLFDYSNAGQDFLSSLELDPNCPEAHFGMGLLNKNLENWDKAINNFNKAINARNKYVEAYCERGFIYENKRNYTQAINDYNRAILEDPSYARAYNLRAELYTTQRQFQLALNDYNYAISKNNGLPDPYYKRAFLYTLMGKYNDALVDIQQAMRLDRARAKYYGLMAKIYAKQGNDSLFFANVNIALEKGYLAMDFQQDPSFREYWDDPRFTSIIRAFEEQNDLVD